MPQIVHARTARMPGGICSPKPWDQRMKGLANESRDLISRPPLRKNAPRAAPKIRVRSAR